MNKLKRSAMSEDIRLLRTACTVMDMADPGLAAEVADYVLTGQPESCLIRIQNLEPTMGNYAPGSHIWEEPSQKYAAENSEIFRSIPDFLASETIQNPYVLQRFSIVINTCSGDHSFPYQQTQIKGWFGNMLALFDDISSRFDANENGRKILCPDRDTLIEIAELFNIPSYYVDAFILEGDPGNYKNHGTFIPYLRETTNWIDLLSSTEYQEKVKTMKVSAREAVCHQLKKEMGTLPETLMPLLAQLLTDRSKIVRQVSDKLSGKIPAQEFSNYLKENYGSEKSDARRRWINLASDLPEGDTLLYHWASTENTESVRNYILEIQERIQIKNGTSDIPGGPIPAYQPDIHIPDDWHTRIRETLDAMIRKEIRDISHLEELLENPDIDQERELPGRAFREIDYVRSKKRLADYKSTENTDIETYLKALKSRSDYTRHTVVARAAERAGLFKSDDIILLQYLRHKWCLESNYIPYNDEKFIKLAEREIIDFRQLSSIFRQHNQDIFPLIERLLNEYDERFIDKLPFNPETISVWQFFTENPDYINKGLKGNPVTESYYDASAITARTLYLLSLFPDIPPQWEPEVYKHAVGKHKLVKKYAQKAAEKSGVRLSNITTHLTSGNRDEKISAVQWLGRLKEESTVSDLYKALGKEKDLSVKAVILDALESLGEDLSEFTTIPGLKAEADKGLQKPIPVSLRSFPKESIPSLSFTDGAPVPSDLVFWWIILAVKLVEPQGNSLFKRYTGLMDRESQERLGLFLISTFISTDTPTASDEECAEYARLHQERRFKNYKSYAEKYNDEKYRNFTLEDAYKSLFREKKSKIIGSAIKNKGILGLISELNSLDTLELLKPYMRKHYTRRAQIEVLLTVIGRFDDDRFIQFLLATVQQNRTESVQKTAISLIEKIAERKQWSRLELAERTIPSAGLEGIDAPTAFSYGHRSLALTLSKDLKLQLLNEKHEPIKALPQAVPDDDQTEIKEIKKWINTCKKDLRQVVGEQSVRLYESMINDQHWVFQEWKERLFQHPIMHQLVQHILWQVKENGEWMTFAIDRNGDFILSSGEKLSVSHASELRILSANQIHPDECLFWQKYLKKNKVKPLFDQLSRAEISISQQQTTLDQAYGYMTDAHSLRKVMEARGYRRSDIDRDKLRFYEYSKHFQGLGIIACLEFTGSHYPEIEQQVAIFSMNLVYSNDDQQPFPEESQTVRLTDAPPNLLNAVALDYKAIADICQPDPDWRSKI